MNEIFPRRSILSFLTAILLIPAALSGAQSLTVVNAASQQAVAVAPGSIIAIYGTNLTATVARSSTALNPPTTLGGVTVTIGGSAAALFYVSPTQINAVVDLATPTGSQTLTVNSSAGSQQATITVDSNAPPGIFSLNGAGTGDGAFVNALTALVGPFTPGTTRGTTYLELFATGLNPKFPPVVTIGGVKANVLFAGASPCCDGLQQINVEVPVSLAGSGRVPVVVTDNGQASNTVQVVLLPTAAQKQFSDDQDDHERARELASLAAVPGTSLVLSTDENDDVVRVINVSTRSVTKVIALSDGASPDGIAVNTAGTTAVVAEKGLGKVAIIDLATNTVTAEVSVGAGPVNVAVAGTLAISVNRDDRSVSVVDLTTKALVKTLPAGTAPRGIAVDAVAGKAYVTNEDDGTISIVNLATPAVASTLTVDANLRIENIVLLPAAGFAFVTVPASNQVLLVNLTTGVTTSFSADPSGTGSTDLAILGSKIYFANQAGGSVSVLPINPTTGAAAGAISTIKVDFGARALAIDVKDNILVVSNEGTGTLVLVDLTSNTVVGRINAVKSNSNGDDNGDDHSDHDGANNAMPVITSLSPATGAVGSTFTITVVGVNLGGATGLEFDVLDTTHGNMRSGLRDTAFTVTNVQANAAGTQVTATVAISGSAAKGPRIVRVVTPKSESPLSSSPNVTFTVQ